MSKRGAKRGRRLDAVSLAEVRAALGEAPRRRDLLIEHLHAVQDAYGGLRRRHLHALAAEMGLAMAEVWEVATFYDRFRHLADEPSPCAAGGGQGGGPTSEARRECVGAHGPTPALRLGPHPNPPPPAAGEGVLGRLTDREAVLAEIERSGLRGLGGAGFPTARKLKAVLAQPAPRLVVVNADEGEPGTFKDLHYLTHERAKVIEGALVAAWLIEAPQVYIYLRDEYSELRPALLADIAGITSPEVILRRGAGAYICGEESALIESLEGKRGLPRHRPPYVAERGLFGRPTLVNNVETLVRLVDVLAEGADAFLAKGRNGFTGERAYSVSGRVRQPGVKMAPNGITVGELIEEYCGGMEPGHRFKAYLPGGASGGFLPADVQPPLAFGAIEPHGGFIGSAGVMILSDQDDLKAKAVELMRFFAAESCGQCTPCRVGTAKAAAMMAEAEWDRVALADLGAVMRDASICGLGQAAPNLFLSLLRHFPEEFP